MKPHNDDLHSKAVETKKPNPSLNLSKNSIGLDEEDGSVEENVYNMVNSSKVGLYENAKYNIEIELLEKMTDTKNDLKALIVVRDSIYAFQNTAWKNSNLGKKYKSNTVKMSNWINTLNNVFQL